MVVLIIGFALTFSWTVAVVLDNYCVNEYAVKTQGDCVLYGMHNENPLLGVTVIGDANSMSCCTELMTAHRQTRLCSWNYPTTRLNHCIWSTYNHTDTKLCALFSLATFISWSE